MCSNFVCAHFKLLQVRTTTEVTYLEPPPKAIGRSSSQPKPTEGDDGPLGPGLRYVALFSSGDANQVSVVLAVFVCVIVGVKCVHEMMGP